jgi:hypothetical protein
MGHRSNRKSLPFDYHQKAYVCTHVFKRLAPVLLVSRPEGDWCFLCGQMHGEQSNEYRIVGIGHLVEQDESLVAVVDLPPDWEAERPKPEGNWIRTPISADG